MSLHCKDMNYHVKIRPRPRLVLGFPKSVHGFFLPSFSQNSQFIGFFCAFCFIKVCSVMLWSGYLVFKLINLLSVKECGLNDRHICLPTYAASLNFPTKCSIATYIFRGCTNVDLYLDCRGRCI